MFYLSQSELEQFRNGFIETLGMDELIVLHPGIVWDCLIKTDCFNVTANFLLDSYVAIFSDVGSNNREAEEAIIVNWSKYVLECEGQSNVICMLYQLCLEGVV